MKKNGFKKIPALLGTSAVGFTILAPVALSILFSYRRKFYTSTT